MRRDKKLYECVIFGMVSRWNVNQLFCKYTSVILVAKSNLNFRCCILIHLLQSNQRASFMNEIIFLKQFARVLHIESFQ